MNRARGERRRGRRLVARGAGALLAGLLVWPAATRADERVLVQGLLDTELWKTDAGSVLLSRNAGDAAAQGRLRLWAAADLLPGLQGFVLEQIEGGSGEEETEFELEQAYVRYSLEAPRRLVVEAGRLPLPYGNFSRRYFSSINPLVGAPDGYDVAYPLGAQVSGGIGRFDYRLAVIDLPASNAKYLPAPDRALRPALAAGFTPVVGLRLGAYATRGPYLAEGLPFPGGAGWKDYAQRIAGFDLAFSRGYFELNADFNRSAYEAPGYDRPVRGLAWFVEPKYTFTPRLFAALRIERNDYAYVQPVAPAFWIAQAVDLYDAEAGLGIRLTQGALLKISYRRDLWRVDETLKPILPDGYAVSAQLSYTFDVNSWVRPSR